MKIEKVKEIIERKSSIPIGNETFDIIEKAYDEALKIIEKEIPKPIKPRECWRCELKECIPNCETNFNRCPKCGEVLDTDCGEQYKYCPNCGQALIW